MWKGSQNISTENFVRSSKVETNWMSRPVRTGDWPLGGSRAIIRSNSLKRERGFGEMLILSLGWLAGPPVPKNARFLGSAVGQGARRREALRSKRVVLFFFLASCLLLQPKANPQVKQVRRVVVFYVL